MDSDSSHRADFTGILGLSVRPLEAEMRFGLRLTLWLMSNFPVWKFRRVHAIQAILRATADRKSGKSRYVPTPSYRSS